MKPRTSNPFLPHLFTIATLLAPPLAHAADGTWNGITGNWTDTTDPGGVWSGGTIANGADFTAYFTGIDIITDLIITLNGNRTIGNITFTDATTPSNNLTITGNTLTLDRTSGVPTIDVTQAGRNLTIESIIAGNDGLQKIGAGTLTLKGTNSFTGGLTIKAGSVTSNGAGGGGNFLSSGTVTIGDSANTGAAATLNFNGSNFTSTNAISVVGTGTSTISVTGWSQILNGGITLSNNLNVVTNNAFGSNLTFGGGVTGTGNLVIQSNAAMSGSNSSKILFQTNALNMVGSITNSGTGSTGTVGNIDTTISAVIGTSVTGVTQDSANSRLNLTGNNTFTSNILVSAGTLLASRVSSSANPTSGALGNTQTLGRTATISSSGTLNFITGDVMGNGGSTPNLTLIANGGTIRNTGSIFNVLGPVQLNGGTLSSFGGGSTAFPSFALTGGVTVGGSAASTISTSGSNSQIGIQNAGTTFNVADATSGSDLNVTGVLAGWNSGTGLLIKTGAGTMTLSNQNTYTGGTRIDNGILALGHATNTLANTGAVNVNGGTLSIGGNSDTVGAVTLTSGSITGSGGTLTGTGSAYDVRSGSVSAKLGGTVGLTKTTSGTVTLSGVNAYSGATAVNAGRLSIDSTGTINSTSSISIGAGELNYNSATALSKAVSFSGSTGTLSGTGTITPAVTITSGNRQTAGTSVTGVNPTAALGKQIFSTGITYDSGSIFEWNLNSTTVGTRGTDFDAVNTAALGGTGAIFRVILNGTEDFSASFWNTDRTWAGIFQNVAESSAYNMSSIFSSFEYYNSAGTVAGVTAAEGAFTFINSGQDLKWTAVPEPTSALAGLLLTAGLLRRRRK